MRILTVRQPWAWAIIHGGKNVENRVRNLAGDYRGPVAVHVAGKYAESGLALPALDDACDAWCAKNGCGKHPWFSGVGRIIGVVDLVDVHHDNTEPCNGPLRLGICSTWADPAVYHLVLADSRPLGEPIPYKGALGLRTLDAKTVALIRQQVES